MRTNEQIDFNVDLFFDEISTKYDCRSVVIKIAGKKSVIISCSKKNGIWIEPTISIVQCGFSYNESKTLVEALIRAEPIMKVISQPHTNYDSIISLINTL